MAADAVGNVFVAGEVTQGGISYGCLTKFSVQGNIRETAVNQAVTYYSAVATAKVETTASTGLPATQHHLVTVGEVMNRGEWVVSRSVNAGVSWVTLDVFKHPSWLSTNPGTPGVLGAAIDGNGNIYVIGHAKKRTVVKNKVSSASYWLVRKIGKDASAVGGEVGKTTMDLFETANGGYSWPKGVTCVGTNVFIAGMSGNRWQVRKNTGVGATWELVDDFLLSSGYPSEANAIAADSSDNLYVAGVGYRAVGRGSVGSWIVRKGTGTGTNSFQELDRLDGAAANGVGIDVNGNVTVTGGAENQWVTRQLTAGTLPWTTIDRFSLKDNLRAQGYDIVAGTAGNLFAAGWAYDGISWHEWVVRQLAPVPPLVP